MNQTLIQPKVTLLFGEWAAASLFLNAGNDITQITNMLGISLADWNYFSSNYCWFQELNHQRFISVFGERTNRDYCLNTRQDFIETYFEQEYHELIGSNPTVSSLAKQVLAQVFQKPYIGVFKKSDWKAHYIGRHPYLLLSLYCHDEINVYLNAKPLSDKKARPIEIADPFSWKLLSAHYLTDGSKLYCEASIGSKHQYKPSFTYLKKADFYSFKTVGENFACDKEAIYYKTNRRIISPSSLHLKIYNKKSINIYGKVNENESDYASDLDYVYFQGKIISEHPDKFAQIDTSDYFSDGTSTFYRGKEI